MLLHLLASSWKEFALYQQLKSHSRCSVPDKQHKWFFQQSLALSASSIRSISVSSRKGTVIMAFFYNISISVLVRLYRPRFLVRSPGHAPLCLIAGSPFNPHFPRHHHRRNRTSWLYRNICDSKPIICNETQQPRPHRGTTIHREFRAIVDENYGR